MASGRGLGTQLQHAQTCRDGKRRDRDNNRNDAGQREAYAA